MAPRATHEGTLPIGSLQLPVAVLDGGIRVLTSSAVLQALGRPYKGNYKRTNLPNFLEAPNLNKFIHKDLLAVLSPIQYLSLGGRLVLGYRAEILPLVCDVYLSARAARKLVPRQEPIAAQAEMLVRSLSKVGIVALIDEATGFQEVRDRLALQAILDKYLQKEFAAWAKRFPDEFYQQIFRLRGWEWHGMKVNRPGAVASYTKEVVYRRLAPNILEELERLNPKNEKGHRRSKHHQFLTVDVGHPALAQHLHAVMALMRLSNRWDDFTKLLNRAFPKRTPKDWLPFDDDR